MFRSSFWAASSRRRSPRRCRTPTGRWGCRIADGIAAADDCGRRSADDPREGAVAESVVGVLHDGAASVYVANQVASLVVVELGDEVGAADAGLLHAEVGGEDKAVEGVVV